MEGNKGNMWWSFEVKTFGSSRSCFHGLQKAMVVVLHEFVGPNLRPSEKLALYNHQTHKHSLRNICFTSFEFLSHVFLLRFPSAIQQLSWVYLWHYLKFCKKKCSEAVVDICTPSLSPLNKILFAASQGTPHPRASCKGANVCRTSRCPSYTCPPWSST